MLGAIDKGRDCTQKRSLSTKKTNNEAITILVQLNGETVRALVDTGAGSNYIHWKYVEKRKLSTEKRERYTLIGLDGKPVEYNQGWVNLRTKAMETTILGKTT